VKTSDVKARYLKLPKEEAETFCAIYSSEGEVCDSRERMWDSIVEASLDNASLMANVLGEGPLPRRDQAAPVSPDDKAAARALARPTATRAELQAEAAAKSKSRFGQRSDEEIARAIYGR